MKITQLTQKDFKKWKVLIQALIEKTESKRGKPSLEWRKTSKENEFILSFTSYSIIIYPSGISIVNDEGEIIDNIEVEDTEEITNHLKNNYQFKNMPKEVLQDLSEQFWDFNHRFNYLYNISRKEAMDIDSAFDNILHELNSLGFK